MDDTRLEEAKSAIRSLKTGVEVVSAKVDVTNESDFANTFLDCLHAFGG